MLLRSVLPRPRVAMVTVAVATVGLVGCVPPPGPAPSLPPTTGVRWVHDTGGAVNEFGTYVPGLQRFAVLGGVGSGPDAVPPGYAAPLTAAGETAFTNRGYFPDGTARFPWSGFAGEGISTVSTAVVDGTDHVVTGPGGSCTFSDRSNPASRAVTLSVQPSPDGTKVAVFSKSWSMEGPTQTSIAIISFTGPCTRIASKGYSWSSYAGDFTGDQILYPIAVWAPNSSSVVYGLGGPMPNDQYRVMRLDAVSGATPSLVLDQPGSQVIPLGWSSADRILIARGSSATTPPSTSTSLETVPVTGGPTKVFSVLTSSVAKTVGSWGYFVPGTQTIVYVGSSQTVTSATGQVFYRPEIRLFDDITGGNGPLAGADVPLLWHEQDGLAVLNSVELDGFVR